MNMTSFTQLLMLLAIPIFLSGMPVNRKGLITGLFVSLYFLGRFNPLLSLVPFGCAIYLFLLTKRSLISRKPPIRFKNPALPMFMVFLLTMGIFCAFGESITGYGQILNLPAAILDSGKSAVNLACLAGPVVFGSWCDKKGPFFAAVLLTLLSETSVLLASSGQITHAFFILGMFLTYFCISGFFVLMPMLSSVFFGQMAFGRVYPLLALLLAVLWQMFPPVGSRNWNAFYQSGDFLASLLFLSILSALFLYLSWRKRLALVTDNTYRAS